MSNLSDLSVDVMAAARDVDDGTPIRRAFSAHLRLVAEALHATGWVEVGNDLPGDEHAAIRACLTPEVEVVAARESLETAIAQAREAVAIATQALKEIGR